MSIFLSIKALVEDGVPKRETARRFGIDVRTVRKHKRRIEQGASGPDRDAGPSKLDDFRSGIEELVKRGMSAVQIYQELAGAAGGFDASYATVRRLVRTLKHKSPEVFCRMRYAPGEEAQVDFGYVGRMKRDGTLRQTWLFVVTLCWSRYAYYELVTDQTVPTFLSAARRAFEFFGGAAQRLKPDNLKAAVLIDRLGQRHYQQDFFDFCRHYNTLPDAARPHTPTDKGRCERDIGYAKGNCFRGREFEDFDRAQAHLVRRGRQRASPRHDATASRGSFRRGEGQFDSSPSGLPEYGYSVSCEKTTYVSRRPLSACACWLCFREPRGPRGPRSSRCGRHDLVRIRSRVVSCSGADAAPGESSPQGADAERSSQLC